MESIYVEVAIKLSVLFHDIDSYYHHTASVEDELISMEHWRSDTDRGKLKDGEKNLSQCCFVNHKITEGVNWHRILPTAWKAGDQTT